MISRSALLLLALALLPAVGQAIYFRDRISWQEPAASDEITVGDARASSSRILWIDARSEEDFRTEHIPGAVLLNAESWDSLLPEMLRLWSPSRKVVVYCSRQSCDASREIARRLREEAGLKDVYVLTGGWETWKEAVHESSR